MKARHKRIALILGGLAATVGEDVSGIAGTAAGTSLPVPARGVARGSPPPSARQALGRSCSAASTGAPSAL